MSSIKLMFLLALWFLFVSDICCAETPGVDGGGISAQNPCLNCSICQYPCHPQPQQAPPPSGYQSSDAPPPPPAAAVGGNCPPVPVVQCCQFPPPVPYSSLPYESNSASLIKPLGTTMWCSFIFFLLLFVFVFHV